MAHFKRKRRFARHTCRMCKYWKFGHGTQQDRQRFSDWKRMQHREEVL